MFTVIPKTVILFLVMKMLTSIAFNAKLKAVREFRGLTQKALGIQMGYDEKTADARIRHYEMGKITPKRLGMEKLAEILRVNIINFAVDESGSLEHIMQMFFWLDEILPGTFNPVQLEKIPRKKDGKLNLEHNGGDAVKYSDSDDFPAAAPMAIWLNNPTLNQFVREWMHRKQELHAGEITRAEYFEWKLNWPQTCDDCGKIEPPYQWRIK